MEVFVKITNDFQRSTTAAKSSILNLIGFLDPHSKVLEIKPKKRRSFLLKLKACNFRVC